MAKGSRECVVRCDTRHSAVAPSSADHILQGTAKGSRRIVIARCVACKVTKKTRRTYRGHGPLSRATLRWRKFPNQASTGFDRNLQAKYGDYLPVDQVTRYFKRYSRSAQRMIPSPMRKVAILLGTYHVKLSGSGCRTACQIWALIPTPTQ